MHSVAGQSLRPCAGGDLRWACSSDPRLASSADSLSAHGEIRQCAVGDATTEVVLVTSDDCGEMFDIMPISEPDPTVPHWLSRIEKQVSPLPLEGPPALMYTRGVKGEGCTPSQFTQVQRVTLTDE